MGKTAAIRVKRKYTVIAEAKLPESERLPEIARRAGKMPPYPGGEID